MSDIVPKYTGRAAVWNQKSRQHPYHCGLSGAVWPQQPVDSPLPYTEINSGNGASGTKAFFKTDDFDSPVGRRISQYISHRSAFTEAGCHLLLSYFVMYYLSLSTTRNKL